MGTAVGALIQFEESRHIARQLPGAESGTGRQSVPAGILIEGVAVG